MSLARRLVGRVPGVRQLANRQDGIALPVVLAFMVLAIPLITTALGLAGTLANDSRVKAGIVKDQYAVLGGLVYAEWLLSDDDFVDGLTPDTPSSHDIDLNDEPVTVIIEPTTNPDSTEPPAEDAVLTTSKFVFPTTASPLTATTYNYTIAVSNTGTETGRLIAIYDGLPVGFTYVTGSTTGATTADPTVTVRLPDDGEQENDELRWDLEALELELEPFEFVTLAFQATAAVGEGSFCNEAWVEPGNRETGTGPTAKIIVGASASDACEGEVLALTKTVTPTVALSDRETVYTYTINVTNTSSSPAEMDWVWDALPPGFDYVNNTTSGTITGNNPGQTHWNGRIRLQWQVPNGNQTLAAGETKTVTFQAEATVPIGTYRNEAWIIFDWEGYTWNNSYAYSWPTADITVMDVIGVTVDAGNTHEAFEIWWGAGGYAVLKK